jgi:AraC-like DNA-binding protein
LHSALSLSFVLLAIWHALAGRATDLVEGRRRLRVVFAVVTALYTVLIVASDWLWPGGLSVASLSLANAVGLISVIFLFAVLESLPSFGQPSAPAAARAGPTQSRDDQPRKSPSTTGPDAALLAALRKLIDFAKVYREPDLSIASLAHKLDIPEYRLRRLINEQLGHRNFSAFINGYRLTEAKTALGDPAQADVPILTIALDAGFGSIGPFNRAFKAQTGLTPTEYRRARLNGAAGAEPSPIPQLTGRL